jgi:hypothetical protein
MHKTTFILAVFVVAILVGLFASMSSTAPKAKEGFMNKSENAPVGGSGMGPYDGVSLPGVAAGWMATENVPTGASPVDTSAPSMLLSNNRSSPSCCPSSISTDAGCLCLGDADKSLFASRGGNRAVA